MPGLIACNRRWGISSDDFVFPAILEIVARCFWLVVIAVVFNIHQDSFQCTSGYFMRMYYIGTLVILCVQICVSGIMAITSMQGAVIEVAKRRYMVHCIYFKWFCFLPELIWTAIGTYWAFTDAEDCKQYIVITVKVAVLAAWGILFLLLVGLLIVFDPQGSKASRGGEFPVSSAAKKLWEKRCKLLCCCAACDDHSSNAFQDVAEIFTAFFEDLDFVATDVVAALILLRSEQKSWSTNVLKESLPSIEPTTNATLYADRTDSAPLRSQPVASSSTSRVYPHPAGWMNLNEAAYYMRFAMGSYGWPLYMMMNLGTGCCKLIQDCRGCQCVGGQSHIVDDNCCECNSSAIYKQTGIDEEDLVYATFHNRIYEIPFYVALDHHNYSVVVSVRGTLSLRDALTDLTADCECLELPGKENTFAHKGMVLASKNIYTKLIDNQLLEQAFHKGQGYRLVIAGHSLGAGAAAILSVLLRPRYPNLICFAYSPPGGLMSENLAQHTEDFVCSVVVGQDLVPRLSLSSLEELKCNLLRVTRDSHQPKYKILATGVWSLLCNVICSGNTDDNHSTTESSQKRHLLGDATNRGGTYTGEQEGVVLPTDSEANGASDLKTSSIVIELNDSELPNTNTELTPMQRSIEEAITSSKRKKVELTTLHPPGHILYIDDTSPGNGCFGPQSYEAMWARPDALNEIIVSHRMVTHHMPDVVYRALSELASRTYTPRHVLTRQVSQDGMGHTPDPVAV